jgi:hypothetical protein
VTFGLSLKAQSHPSTGLVTQLDRAMRASASRNT